MKMPVLASRNSAVPSTIGLFLLIEGTWARLSTWKWKYFVDLLGWNVLAWSFCRFWHKITRSSFFAPKYLLRSVFSALFAWFAHQFLFQQLLSVEFIFGMSQSLNWSWNPLNFVFFADLCITFFVFWPHFASFDTFSFKFMVFSIQMGSALDFFCLRYYNRVFQRE